MGQPVDKAKEAPRANVHRAGRASLEAVLKRFGMAIKLMYSVTTLLLQNEAVAKIPLRNVPHRCISLLKSVKKVCK